MIRYQLEPADPHAHQYRVRMTVPAPSAGQVLSLPVWIPGSYLVREFARHVSQLEARQGRRKVALVQIDKASWRAECRVGTPLELSYLVYAFDTSVRAAFLDARRGFFNGTGVFLRAHGHEALGHRLEIAGLPEGWQVATALRPLDIERAGRASFAAADYDELADQPVELGTFWRGRFEAAGVPHELVVTGALPSADLERLLADMRRICETQIAFWHGADGTPAPFERYVFLLNLVDDGYGGLEHRASTALIAARRDLPRQGQAGQTDGYVILLGLISHEYFHSWNVKRLKPAEFARYDYTQENYTELLWFFEGFTSYYDDLLLLRAGLIDEARYLKLLAKHWGAVQATPGRRLQSVAESSFDAWIKYYRADENTANATVSYYAKGALVALAFDLSLRHDAAQRRSAGRRASLDAVMRRLWQASGAAGGSGPIDEAQIAAALEAVGGRSYADELAAWVHGTQELPLEALLAHAGVRCAAETPTTAQRLGLRVGEGALTGVIVKSVLRGGAAERAGFSPGDEWLGVNGWRLRRLEDLATLAPAGSPVECLVARDQRLLTLPLAWPVAPAVAPVGLSLDGQASRGALALRRGWFSG